MDSVNERFRELLEARWGDPRSAETEAAQLAYRDAIEATNRAFTEHWSRPA